MASNAISLATLKLDSGSHDTREDGMCLMEAVAYFADEPHSDKPVCACPVLTAYGITLNDRFPAAKRQELKRLIPSLVGSRSPDLEQRRMYFLLDKAVRVFTSIALRNAAKALIEAKLDAHAVILEHEAVTLEALAVIDSAASARSAASAAASARSAASAAASAESAAESAAWSAESAAESAAYDIAIQVFADAIAIGAEEAVQ